MASEACHHRAHATPRQAIRSELLRRQTRQSVHAGSFSSVFANMISLLSLKFQIKKSFCSKFKVLMVHTTLQFA